MAALACATILTPTVASAAVEPGTLIWAETISGASFNAVTVGPDGSVFVTGGMDGAVLTASYTAAGDERWAETFDPSPDCCAGAGLAIAVSPDGETVFVTGSVQTIEGIIDQVTIGYDAASGDELWTELYDRGSMDEDESTTSQHEVGFSISVSPDGGTVFTGGEADVVIGDTIHTDYSALAYDATTGDLAWAGSYDGGGWDSGRSIGMAPDGSAVYLTGIGSAPTYSAATTVAFDTSNGDRLWAKRYQGPAGFHDSGLALDVSPDGTSVVITGGTGGTGSGTADWDMFVAAYATSSGTKLWSKVIAGPLDGYDFGRSLAVGPDGTKVFVLGHSLGTSGAYDITTVALALTTGTRLWSARAPGPAANTGLSGGVAVTPDGKKVVVSSYRGSAPSYDLMTISYTAAGVKRWSKRYDEEQGRKVTGVALSPSGSRTYITGGLTLAYKT
jgi:hypothetical protein